MMKLSEVVKAWEEGKQIQYLDCGTWVNRGANTYFNTGIEYRIKPETLKYRVGLFKFPCGTFNATTVCAEGQEQALRATTSFVRWVTDWIEVEV